MPDINYAHAMSKEEVEESNRRLARFWKHLDQNAKYSIWSLMKPFYSETMCKHEYVQGKWGGSKCRWCDKFREGR